MYAYMCVCQKSLCSYAIPWSISKQIQMVVVLVFHSSVVVFIVSLNGRMSLWGRGGT